MSFEFQVKNDSEEFMKKFPRAFTEENPEEWDMYSTNSIAWGAIVEILKNIASDIITEEEFRDISFNHGQEFDSKRAKAIGKRLIRFAKKLPAGETKFPTTKESMLTVGGVTESIQDEDDVFTYPNEAIIEKDWLKNLGELFKESHGIYIS